MIQMIVGNKGKGKTKILLDHVNASIKEATGNIVFLDKSNKNMYELNNKIRLINLLDYPVVNSNEFIGFLLGIISQDSDLQEVYIDSLLALSNANENEVSDMLEKLQKISEQYKLKIMLSISLEEAEIPDTFKESIFVAL